MQEKDVHVHVSLVLVVDPVDLVTKDVGGLFEIKNHANIVYFLHKPTQLRGDFYFKLFHGCIVLYKCQGYTKWFTIYL